MFLSSYEIGENEHSKLGELYNGIQMCKKNKIYIFMLLCRRALFVAVLITLTLIPLTILISILSFIQLIYFIYISILRPFKEIKCNIIEIINEAYFLLLFSGLIFLNTQNEWNSTFTNIYVWVISSNFLCTSIIVLTSFIIKMIKKCVKGSPKVADSSSTTIKRIEVKTHQVSQSFAHMSRSSQIYPNVETSIANNSEINNSAVNNPVVNRCRYLIEENKIVLDDGVSNIAFIRC